MESAVNANPLSKPLSKRKGLSLDIARALVFLLITALAFPVAPAMADPGTVTDNSGLIPFDQAYFAFEVESVLSTMKEVPIWDELEQMLDHPYAIFRDPNVGGNDQGFPSYRASIQRRKSFVFRDSSGNPCAPGTGGCINIPLPSHVIHPLNYNHMNGEELRLLNVEFEEAPWQVPDALVHCSTHPETEGCTSPDPTTYVWTYRDIDVSAGEDRIEEEEAAIDFNSPMKPDTSACISSAEIGIFDSDSVEIPEGSIICGGDPGEPGYAGFGVLLSNADRDEQYSTPALKLPDGSGPGTDITPGLGDNQRRLFDPAGCAERNAEFPGSCNGQGFINRLRKPSLRSTLQGQPNYIQNSEATLAADPAALKPSNENDYYRGNKREDKVAARDEAAVLGKALFWDMQMGSDGVQSCGSCHFHAGVDNRTKNQLNPNHLGNDFLVHVGHATSLPDGSQPGNQNVTAADFPFHKLNNISVPVEETNCGVPGLPSCSGLISDVNDVMSSMGVIFSPFTDIKPLAQFITNTSGVKVVPPDIRTAGAIDPIAVFQGLRRVEPRNTPTFFGATLNFDNFWDGRARHDFNGGSVFGASDPQSHVFVNDDGNLTRTRQVIRFVSLASLATGPGLSNFEMSFEGRNWSKVAKKLLQGFNTSTVMDNVTPLANQLVDTNDSVLGVYSNQGGTRCNTSDIQLADRSGSWVTNNNPGLASGKPGLCISYAGLIRRAYYPALWNNTSMHLNGCYTDDGNPSTPQNTPVCATPPSLPVLSSGTINTANTHDPFDGYILSIASGEAAAANTNQFTQMEANFTLFFGLSVHAWTNMLIPDDTPMDRFYDVNPDSFVSFGEAGEPGLVIDLRNCYGENGTNGVQPCFTEVGNFKRDPGIWAYANRTAEGDTGTPIASGGTRVAGTADPLLGMDFFLGSNLSLKNPNYQSLRCGECHAGGTLTDHTVEISHQFSFNDFVAEFAEPGVELNVEPLGRSRVISGFSLESEANGNAQDAIERNLADFCAVEPCVDLYGNPIPGGVAGGFPQGQALFDNGVYNLGIRPIAEDNGRGGLDAFGFPLSLSDLMLKNLGGVSYTQGGNDPSVGFMQPGTNGSPGFALANFDPGIDPVGGGLFEPTKQDQQLNPGFEEEPIDPQLPPYLAPWASNNVVGDETEQDEVFMGLNTTLREPILEGFLDAFGPFNPAGTIGENFNNGRQPAMATWPNVNRVNAQGSFKAAPLRNVELTGPYFHNGGKLTLRQQLDFYLRGGDFPKLNSAHRDFLVMNLDLEDEALGGCIDPTVVDINGRQTRPTLACDQAGAVPEFTEAQKEEIRVAVIDFLLELTDERVAFERAPFDHPEIFVPLDGTAPDNTFGRPGFLTRISGDCGGVAGAGPCFRQVPAVGQGGIATRLPNFLNIASGPRLVGGDANCGAVANNHYCH